MIRRFAKENCKKRGFLEVKGCKKGIRIFVVHFTKASTCRNRVQNEQFGSREFWRRLLRVFCFVKFSLWLI